MQLKSENICYFVVSVKSSEEEFLYHYLCEDKSEANKSFKIVENFKKNIDHNLALKINCHIWGAFEVDMLLAAGTPSNKVNSLDDLISNIEYCIGL